MSYRHFEPWLRFIRSGTFAALIALCAFTAGIAEAQVDAPQTSSPPITTCDRFLAHKRLSELLDEFIQLWETGNPCYNHNRIRSHIADLVGTLQQIYSPTWTISCERLADMVLWFELQYIRESNPLECFLPHNEDAR